MKKQIIATSRKLIGTTREYESSIERHQSPLKMRLIPIATVMLGSMITSMPFFTDEPLLPPMGFMILIAWRLMRPGMWPTWVGMPFGLYDDLWSGQPFGSAGLLWSIAMLGFEFADSRAAWRDHIQDWFLAAIAIMLVIFGGLGISNLAHRAPETYVLVPQILISILTFPLIVRLCARFDKWRLST
jgi:rod shape-determining protein MreD